MNRATIIGNLGADPEEIARGAGCKFSIATNERWTDKQGQQQEKTEWHRITCWGRTAENCMKYLSKGRQVCVVGRIQTDEYEKNGEKRYSTGIVAREVEFLSGGDSAGGGGRERRRRPSGGRERRRRPSGGRERRRRPSGGGNRQRQPPYNDDDIPF